MSIYLCVYVYICVYIQYMYIFKYTVYAYIYITKLFSEDLNQTIFCLFPVLNVSNFDTFVVYSIVSSVLTVSSQRAEMFHTIN